VPYRILAAHIATAFPQDLFGARVDLIFWLKAIARIGSQETFGHPAPARVAGEKNNCFLPFRHVSFLRC
jgi:hypothetical protein